MKIEEEIKDSNFEKDCLFCVYDTDPKRKVEPYEYPCSECNGYNKFERYDPDQEERNKILDAQRRSAIKIINEIDNRLHFLAEEYHTSGHPEYFAVCETIHHKVIRKVERNIDNIIKETKNEN